MATSQRIRKGMQNNRIARSKPQNDWDSFSPVAGIPKDVKGDIPLLAEKTRSNRTEPEAEGFAQEGKMIEASFPQQKIPRRRGRLRKNKDAMGSRFP
jgi:hypothetical protein